MTIVSGPDKRNQQWASDKSSFGQRMLLKMGWKEGKGLGKNEEGTNTNLRAVKREEGLGIGAKTDLFGDDGFSKTSKNFHGVLATLHAEHGAPVNAVNNGSDKNNKKESSKKAKKNRKQKKSKEEGTLTLSQTKVTAGHARKMRESKDLSKKSKEDMAAIFGMKVNDYENNSVWGRLSSLSSTVSSRNDEDGGGEEKKIEDGDDINAKETISKEEKKKRRKDKKKRKRKDETNTDESEENSDDMKTQKKKKKRKDKK